MMRENSRASESFVSKPGPFLARVVSHLDPKYMGTLQVELLQDVGNSPDTTGSLYQVKYLSPFYGVTGMQFVGPNNTYSDTQKSYGMWMIPPDPGSLVMVIFVDGNAAKGYWIGCVQDEYMNFMIPGLAATELNTDGGGKKVVAEYNKRLNDLKETDTTRIKKPVHPFTKVLESQGLLEDETRGITTSSARREVPSMVFGISTPGPVDRRQGAPKGNIGKKESKITGAFISRLGGSTFVMDDGDDKFLRKSPASDGPSEYVSIENGEKGGQPDIPHNELIRIRTRTGHQILLHNSEDLIYIGNARGTSWIELTSNGKIDIWAEDSISIHTANDLNVTADRDINFKAGRNINFTAESNIKTHAASNYDLVVGADGKIKVSGTFNLKSGGSNKFTAGGNTDIKSGGNHVETASQIHMNGPAASEAADAEIAPIPNRVPMAEPWYGHENLDPKSFTPAKTGAIAAKDFKHPVKLVQKILDTFRKLSR